MDWEYDVGMVCVWSEEINCVRRGGSADPPRSCSWSSSATFYALMLFLDAFAGTDVAVLSKPVCIAACSMSCELIMYAKQWCSRSDNMLSHYPYKYNNWLF